MVQEDAQPHRIGTNQRPASWHTLRFGLAGLWILDGLLQLQPGMFTMDMISTIMQPVANGEPPWLHHLIAWSILLVTPHLVTFNWTVVAVQILIGLLLLAPWPNVLKSGLWLSIVWSALVWLFGEGLGQLLTGSATFITGAPGSVFFYGVAAGLLLWSRGWRGRWPLAARLATQVVALSLLLAAALQLVPIFWTSLGLATSIGSAATMAQPAWMRAPIDWSALWASRLPVVVNALIILACLSLGVLVMAAPHSRWVVFAAICWLVVVWWIGQDLGALTSGMATDPNSAPVLALLLITGWRARRDATLVVALHPERAAEMAGS